VTAAADIDDSIKRKRYRVSLKNGRKVISCKLDLFSVEKLMNVTAIIRHCIAEKTKHNYDIGKFLSETR